MRTEPERLIGEPPLDQWTAMNREKRKGFFALFPIYRPWWQFWLPSDLVVGHKRVRLEDDED